MERKITLKKGDSNPNNPEVALFFNSNIQDVLSPIEQTVTALIITGRTNLEIAELLKISEGTARNYVSEIFSRIQDHTGQEVRRPSLYYHLFSSGLARMDNPLEDSANQLIKLIEEGKITINISSQNRNTNRD